MQFFWHFFLFESKFNAVKISSDQYLIFIFDRYSFSFKMIDYTVRFHQLGSSGGTN